MTIREDLVYFLKNGRFENIDFGITRAQLKSVIGEPDFTLPPKSKIWPSLYKYGNLEFWFEDRYEDARLHGIQFFVPVIYERKGRLIFNSHRWTVELTFEKAIKFLQKHKIGFEEREDYLDFWRSLETESGVRLDFTNQSDESIWALHWIGKKIELKSRKTPAKQISCEIETRFYEQLKRKAQTTRKSIAHLCREIIEKHLENSN